MLHITGNVLNVLEGRVESSRMQLIKPEPYRFALGSGSFSDPKRIGETIVLESKPTISWVEKDKVHTETHTSFYSPFLIGIDHQHPIAKIVHPKKTTLQKFYETLSKEYPGGFALIGHAKIDELYSTYLKKPPIYHENINENHMVYWQSLPVELNQFIVFFGVVIPPEAKKKFSSDFLQKAFYQNPAEKTASHFDSHTHAALVQPSAIDQKKFLPENLSIQAVRHLLTSTLIQEGTFAIFAI